LLHDVGLTGWLTTWQIVAEERDIALETVCILILPAVNNDAGLRRHHSVTAQLDRKPNPRSGL
jgi:hypothetical protein